MELKRRKVNVCMHSQLLSACGGFFHAVSLLQQLKELLHGDAGVRRASQGKNLPQQDAKGPPAAAAHRINVGNVETELQTEVQV